MFISGREAIEKYHIFEAQLGELLKTGKIKPYDIAGREISPERLKRLLSIEFEKAKQFILSRVSAYPFDEPDEELLQTVSAKALEVSPMKLATTFVFVKKEFEAALASLYPESFGEIVSPPTQEKTVDSQSNKDVDDKENHIDKNIEAWEAVLYLLTGIELMAAKLAIEKWKGKPHEEAFKAIRPGDVIQDPKNFVCKKKKTAEQIARRYNLPMPPWKSK